MKAMAGPFARWYVASSIGDLVRSHRHVILRATWLRGGSVPGPELGRETESETCKNAGASAGYWYDHVRVSNRTPRSDRHSRELALEVLPVMKAVAGPLRAGTWPRASAT